MIITDRETIDSEIRRRSLRFINSVEYYPEWDLLIHCNEKESQDVTATFLLNLSGQPDSDDISQDTIQTQTITIDCSSGDHRIILRPIKPYVISEKFDYAVLKFNVDFDIAPIPLREEFIAANSNDVESRRLQQIIAMRYQIRRMLKYWERGFIFKRLRSGPVCTHCTDPVTKKKPIKNCEFCLDTGVLYGYEHVPFETGIFTVEANKISQAEFVPNKKGEYRFFVENIVEVLPEDIILVPAINAAFIVGYSTRGITAWGYGIAREIIASLLPKDSVQHRKLYERLNQLYSIY